MKTTKILWQDNNNDERHSFLGKEKDEESDLGDYGVRKYDDLTGRFTTTDPLWEKYYGWSPYVYSANDPVNKVDLTGKNWFSNSNGDINWFDLQGDFSDNIDKTTWTDLGLETLHFNGKKLGIYKRDKTFKEWSAVSGKLKNGKTNPSRQHETGGPIPEGEYNVNYKETLSARNSENILDLAKWIIKSPSWGLFITPIKSKDGSSDYNNGRNNMFIHGGMFPGSAGCIDLTNNNYYFHMELQKFNYTLPLIVNYPK